MFAEDEFAVADGEAERFERLDWRHGAETNSKSDCIITITKAGATQEAPGDSCARRYHVHEVIVSTGPRAAAFLGDALRSRRSGTAELQALEAAAAAVALAVEDGGVASAAAAARQRAAQAAQVSVDLTELLPPPCCSVFEQVLDFMYTNDADGSSIESARNGGFLLSPAKVVPLLKAGLLL